MSDIKSHHIKTNFNTQNHGCDNLIGNSQGLLLIYLHLGLFCSTPNALITQIY